MRNELPNQEDFSKMSRKERREKALDQIFGENRKEYMGNIWGWKFSMMSLIGLLLVGALATFGVMTGRIDLSKQQIEMSPSKHFEQQRFSTLKKDTTIQDNK